MQKRKETGRQTQSKIVRVILNAPKQSMKMLFYVQLVCVSFHCENTSNYGDLFPPPTALTGAKQQQYCEVHVVLVLILFERFNATKRNDTKE